MAVSLLKYCKSLAAIPPAMNITDQHHNSRYIVLQASPPC
jgi:hypothetical protein